MPDPDHNVLCIQQALEDLAGFQGYPSAAVDSLNRLRGERDRLQAALEDRTGRYRLLSRGEVVQATDEYLTDDTVTWNLVMDNFAGRAFIGKPWNPIVMQPIRRPI